VESKIYTNLSQNISQSLRYINRNIGREKYNSNDQARSADHVTRRSRVDAETREKCGKRVSAKYRLGVMLECVSSSPGIPGRLAEIRGIRGGHEVPGASGVDGVRRVSLPSTVVNCGGPGRPSAGRSRTIQQESRMTQRSRAPLALHQGMAVPDDEHGVGDGRAVAATRISTTTGPTRRRHQHLRPTRTHACTHAPAAVVPARPRRSTLPGLLPVSHLRPIAEARAIDHAHSHHRAELRSSVSLPFFPSSSISPSLPPALSPATRVDPNRAPRSSDPRRVQSVERLRRSRRAKTHARSERAEGCDPQIPRFTLTQRMWNERNARMRG